MMRYEKIGFISPVIITIAGHKLVPCNTLIYIDEITYKKAIIIVSNTASNNSNLKARYLNSNQRVYSLGKAKSTSNSASTTESPISGFLPVILKMRSSGKLPKISNE